MERVYPSATWKAVGKFASDDLTWDVHYDYILKNLIMVNKSLTTWMFLHVFASCQCCWLSSKERNQKDLLPYVLHRPAK